MDIERDKTAAAHFWRHGYCQPFMDKNPALYAEQFALPCMIKAENMPRTVFTTREALLGYVTEMIDRASATTWERSEIDRCDVAILDADVAKVSVDASRYDAAGRLLSRLYADYTLNKVGGEWKMVSIFGGFHPDEVR